MPLPQRRSIRHQAVDSSFLPLLLISSVMVGYTVGCKQKTQPSCPDLNDPAVLYMYIQPQIEDHVAAVCPDE